MFTLEFVFFIIITSRLLQRIVNDKEAQCRFVYGHKEKEEEEEKH